MEMIQFEKLTDAAEIDSVRQLIIQHLEETDSSYALDVLAKWEQFVPQFVKVVPVDYKEMLEKIDEYKLNGLTYDNAAMQAFVEVTGSQKKLVSSK